MGEMYHEGEYDVAGFAVGAILHHFQHQKYLIGYNNKAI
ncbi:phosphoribosylformylglycinamidine cyclo-ligase [Staphylococcus aureus]|nr:phosphoribosylformylglycinamidine cyclo-ligase [Staphylococcus aureus]